MDRVPHLFARAGQLRVLKMNGAPLARNVTDADTALLLSAFPDLRSLSVCNLESAFGDGALAALITTSPALRSLYCCYTGLTTKGWELLEDPAALPNLRVLSYWNDMYECPGLRALLLYYNKEVGQSVEKPKGKLPPSKLDRLMKLKHTEYEELDAEYEGLDAEQVVSFEAWYGYLRVHMARNGKLALPYRDPDGWLPADAPEEFDLFGCGD